jgi:enterochelin esterase-like enzyme
VWACAWALLAPGLVMAQDRSLPPLVQGDLSPQAEQVYTARVAAGDLVSGVLELVRGGAIAFEVFGPDEVKVKSVHVDEPGRADVGFAAATSGDYRVRINRVHVADGEVTPSTYVLQTRTVPPSVRMRGSHVQPVVRYTSPRLVRLGNDVRAATPGALADFWREARAGNGVLIEPFDGRVDGAPAPPPWRAAADGYVLVTFLWLETFETHNVVVLASPWDVRPDDYFMSRLPGTDVWYKSVLLPLGSRLHYALSPNDRPDERAFTQQRDPLNPRTALGFDELPDASLLELEGAPDESSFRTTPASRGRVTQQRFVSTLLGGHRPVSIYTPPGHSTEGGPYPLLLLFDGVTYTSGFEAIGTLDTLISSGRIPPVVACFLTSPGTRATDIGVEAKPAFAEAMATELVPWLRATFAVTSDPTKVVIGGYSAGGVGAARIAFRYPGTFGNVLSQSGAFGWAFESSPVIREFRDGERQPLRFHLDVGLLDYAPLQAPAHELALAEGITVGNRHFRDVLMAKGYDVTYRETGGQHNSLHFRATLADGLMTLFARSPGR